MKLKTLKLTNFRNYEDFRIDFNEKLNVIVAENGVGKTTILDAIALAYGAMLTRIPKINGKNIVDTDIRIIEDTKKAPYCRIEAKMFNGVKWDRTLLRDKSKQTKQSVPEAIELKQLYNYVDDFIDKENESISHFDIPLIMYYGTSRAVLKSPMRRTNFKKKFSRFEAFSGVLNANTDFHRLFQWYDAMEDIERREIKERRDFDFKLTELEAVREAIKSMLHGVTNPRIEPRPLRFLVDKIEDEKVYTYRVDQLSDGYKTVLAMVMDIASRMAEANPHKKNPLESEAIIMIDEVDLHLHPRWQQTILIDLQKTFPNAQFIVTTHSPQVLTTIKAESIQAVKLINSKPEIYKFDFAYGARSHELLNEILGVDERPQNLDIVQKLNRYLQLVNENRYDCDEALQLRDELDSWGAGKEKELLKVDMDIKVKEYQKIL